MTPAAIDLLAQIHARGVDVSIDGDRLRFNPAGILLDLLPAIRQHKTNLIALSTVNGSPGNPGENTPSADVDDWEAAEPWPSILRPLRAVVPESDAERGYWEAMTPDAIEWLNRPRSTPCAFCGGHATHSEPCRRLLECWEPRLTFGKHAGSKASEVPTGYAKWLLSKVDRLSPELRAALERAAA